MSRRHEHLAPFAVGQRFPSIGRLCREFQQRDAQIHEARIGLGVGLHLVLDLLDLDLSDMIKLTARVGHDGAGQLVFAMRDAEPPDVVTDLAVSIALVMPDGVGATLIGDPAVTQQIKGEYFRVSAGSYFHPSAAGATQLIDTVLNLAQLNGSETIIDCFAGVGVLSRFLAQDAAELIAIERNPDAVEDFATNLGDLDNVAIYNDWAEEALAAIEQSADLYLLDTDGNQLAEDIGNALLLRQPRRILYSSPNLAAAAQDAQKLAAVGYNLVTLHAIDTQPQTHQIHTIGLWQK